jgi:hypothetical protein
LNPTAIFSKTGKGVQEASGKTSDLSRADRAVLKEIDGKTTHANVAAKFEKIPAAKFDALIQQFDKDGYIREVSSGSQPAAAPPPRSAAPAKAAPPPPPPSGGSDDDMDFTQAIKLPPKAPAVDLAAASRAEAERKEKEKQAFDYKARQEAELKAKAQAEAKAKAESEARAKALAEAKARAESEAKAKAEAEARVRAAAAAAETEAKAKALAEAEAKVKAAREAAIRMAAEVKAKAEAEGKAKADAAEGREREALEKARKESEDKARLEAELTGKLEEERKAREDAERRASEAADRARKELEEKARRDADELRQRLEAEMKAKLDEERKAREEEDRKRREEEDRKRAEEDRKRREEDERRRKEEEERRAKEAAERKAREEEDRKRREEDDRRRKEEDERRAKDEAERRAREEAEREADRKRREEEDRKRADEEKRRKEEDERRAKEEAARRARDEADRKAKDDADRRAREDAERKAKEETDARVRAAQVAASQSSSTPSIPPVPVPPPTPPAGGGIDDSLLADLDSFGKREEEEQRAKEEADRKAKEEAARKAKAEAERKAKEEADRRAKDEAEKKRREDEARKAKEEAEQRARDEAEQAKQEEEERKRKAKEALAAKEAERKAAQRAAAAKTAAKGPAADEDIDVSDDDLGMDDVKKDEKALSATARKAAREREHAAAALATVRRPRKWGKPAAIALFVLLIAGVGVLQLMPVSTAEYEKAASDAMGVPVKIGSARLSVITGIEARFEGVSVGETVKIRTVRGYPEIGSLFGGRKSFSRIELEGVSLSQSQMADAMLGKIAGENFRVARIVIKQAKLDGPLELPALDVDAMVSGDGSMQSITLRGGDKLSVQLSPKGNDIGFEISAASLALPLAPALTLSDFSMKGTANRSGVTMSEFDGRASDGVISGSAKIRWGANWSADGEIRVRGLKVAVLAPALVSEGKVEARGAYSMSGPKPATLFESARIQGEFKIEQGVLGSFDLTRALQTGGAQSSGRTIFTELTGQAVYDRGAVKITNAAISAGAMNAGASLDIDAGGGLAGRVVADVKTPNQTLRATLNISGKIQDPVIRK